MKDHVESDLLMARCSWTSIPGRQRVFPRYTSARSKWSETRERVSMSSVPPCSTRVTVNPEEDLGGMQFDSFIPVAAGRTSR